VSVTGIFVDFPFEPEKFSKLPPLFLSGNGLQQSCFLVPDFLSLLMWRKNYFFGGFGVTVSAVRMAFGTAAFITGDGGGA